MATAGGTAMLRRVNWTLADQVVVSGGNFLTSILVARFLGVVAFGVFTLLWIGMLFAQSIVTAAISSPMMSIGPKHRGAEADEYYAASVHQQLAVVLLALVLLAVAGVLGAFSGPDVAWRALLLPLGACFVFGQLQDFLRKYSFAVQSPQSVLWSDLLRYTGQIIGLLFLLSAPASDVQTVLWVIAAASLLGVLAFAGRYPPLRRPPPNNLQILSRNLQLSRWLMASAVLQWTTVNFFVLASGLILGPATAGGLRAAQTLIGVAHVFFQAADNIVPPHAARLYHADGFRALRSFTLRLLVAGMAGTALLGLFLSLPADFWLSLFFGHEFAADAWLVGGYAVIYLLLAAAMPMRYAFTAMEQTRPIFVSYAWATLFSIVAAVPLLQAAGLVGAMVGMAVTAAIIFASLAISFTRTGDR